MATEKIEIVVSERGSRTVKRNIDEIGEGAASAARDVDLLSVAISALAALSLGALVTQVVSLGREFTTTLAKIKTNVDEATFDMDKLTEAALRQSTAFASTPVKQAEALYDIISAGAETAEEAIDKLTAANKLAVGGITTVGVAADGLTSVLNAYGSKIESAEAAADAMFIAARDGKTTIDALSSSLGRVAPIAAQMGVSFDEVNGVIAALTKGGVSTEESVTGLRAILASVAKPTKEASDMAKQLGLEFNTAALQSKGFQAFLEDVAKKTKGSIPALSQLFGGVEALVPALALTGQAGEDFAKTMENMANKAGSAEAAFQKMANSPGFLMDKIMARITEEGTRLGTALLTAVTPALKVLADNMDVVLKAAYALGIGLTVAFAPAAIVAGIGLITTALTALTAIMLANPFTLIAVAVATAVAALYLFGDQIMVTNDGITSMRDVFAAVFEYIGEAVSATTEFFTSAWETAGDDVTAAADAVVETFKVMGQMILGFMKGTVNTYVGLWVGAYNTIIAAWNLFPGAMADLATMAGNALIEIVGNAVQGVINAVQSLLTFLGSAATLVGAENPFANLISPDGIKKSLDQYKGTVTGAAKEVGKIVKDEFGKSLGTDYVGAAADGAKGAMDAVLTRAQQIARDRIAAQKDADLSARPNGGLQLPTPAIPGAGGAGDLGAGAAGKAKKAKEELTDAEKKYKEVLESIQQPQKDFELTLAAANKLLAEGKINAEQHARAIRDVAIAAAEAAGGPLNGLRAGLMSLQLDSQDMAKGISDAVQNAFSGMEDALVEFVTTGKMDFGKLVDSIIADIARLVIRYMVIQPIINALSGAFGSLFGGGAAVGGSATVPMPSYATGGGFTVGGAGGVDSQLVQFMASPGERVSVSRPGESVAPSRSGPTRTTVNVYNNGQPVQAQAETSQAADGSLQIDVLLEQIEERMAGKVAKGGGTLNKALEGRYALDAARGIQR